MSDVSDENGWRAYDRDQCAWVPIPRLTWDQHAQGERAPFCKPLSLCTWNSQGPFCVDDEVRCNKLRFLLDFATSHDVVIVLETLDDGYRGRHVETLLRGSHRCFWNPLDDSGHAGGTATFFRCSLLPKFRYVCDRVFTPGRCQVVEADGSRGNLQIFGIHFYPILDDARRVRTLLHLRSELKPTRSTLLAISILRSTPRTVLISVPVMLVAHLTCRPRACLGR